MGKIEIQYNPEMTAQDLKDIVARGFAHQYEMMEKPGLFGIDFAVKKTGWTGMAFKLIQKPKKNKTFIAFNPFVPSMFRRVMLGGLVSLIVLSATSWKEMTAEVQNFLMSSTELKALEN